MISNALYQILNQETGKFLQTTESKTLILANNGKNTSQLWKFEPHDGKLKILTASSNYCLSAESNSLKIEDLGKKSGNFWIIQKEENSLFRIMNKKTKTAIGLEIDTKKTDEKSKNYQVALVPKSLSPEQLWIFIPKVIPYRYIVNQNSGKVLDVFGSSKNENAKICQSNSFNKSSQKWALQITDNHMAFAIINKKSGLCLSMLDESSPDGSNLVQQTFQNKNHQLWVFQPVENHFYLISKANTKCATVFSGSLDSGAPVTIYPVYFSDVIGENQLWNFIDV
ncbi:hypothetical protein M0811_11112 [Anaeramoeba ignava]|uniref:Ricin B lectin domain-containing protein n=1 Tax=Anaeramoeba ignava TaxID=1746090 RepID=A0A9Q0LD95_ANAIG|nr:hypothetical protein M0811_11112 [Anaeramoeba ignava]